MVQLEDRNTTFFYSKTVSKKKRNKIELLKDEDGSWVSKHDILSKNACCLFQKLYIIDTQTYTYLSYQRYVP